MARYLGVIERYEQICVEGGQLLTQLYDAQGDMVRFRLPTRWQPRIVIYLRVPTCADRCVPTYY